MRYCRHCRKWNAGEPLRCRFCSAGLAGRLCPSGHVNPPDRHLAYCGDCGKPLEQRWGAGFSFKPYLLGAGVLMATVLISTLLQYAGHADAPVVTAIMVLIIVVIGFRLAFRILPPWVGTFIGEAASFFMRLILGTGIKGRK
jgi:hypothetical protein